jgi:RNase P/RNase MRP subunit p29
MATALRLRRGTTSQHSSFTGLEGEVTVDTTKDTLVVHDGSTAGGFPMARDSAVIHTTGAESAAGLKTFNDGIATDTVAEKTAAAGVTIDGVLLKDSEVTTDVIKEKTSAAGVTIDSVVLKDGGVTLTAPAILPDGSASAPAVTNTGDTNTGLYFPAADEVAIAAGGTTVLNASSTFGFKNRIINGRMEIDQRNAGASVTVTTGVNTTYYLDRWVVYNNTNGTATIQRSTTAPTGFINSLIYTVGTVDTSIAADQFATIRQPIEGLNVSDLSWGTANAKSVTLSFWVRSSATGTFCASFFNDGGARSYVATYTISSANTWEYKTITIAGDTSGTWLTTTGIGLYVSFALCCGTDFQTTAGSWQTFSYGFATSAQTNLFANTGATFYITGVQLEVGSTATSFDFRPYGTELALCQRYYYRTTYGANSTTLAVGAINSTTSAAQCGFTHPVTMRASPTAGYSGVTVYDGSTNTAVTSISAQSSSTTHSTINVGATGGSLTVGRAACILAANSTQYLDFAIEL